MCPSTPSIGAPAEASFQNSGFGYLRLQIDGSGYKSFARDKYVLAGRLRIGSIFGASRDRIAPSRRFYSGGGGSVRGFGFQDIGPKDAFDDPIGGRSLAEAAIELRARFGDFGIVPFVDGGQIFTGPLPRFDSFRVGAGIGVRYHTSFGPILKSAAKPQHLGAKLKPADGSMCARSDKPRTEHDGI